MNTYREYKFYFQYHDLTFFSPQSDKKSSPQKEVKYEPFSFADGKWKKSFQLSYCVYVCLLKVKLLSWHLIYFFSGIMLF